MEVVEGAKSMCKQIEMQMITYQHIEVYRASLHTRRQQLLKPHGKLTWHLPALYYSHRIFGRKKFAQAAHWYTTTVCM